MPFLSLAGRALVAVALWCGSAMADKPKVAVLGLEVTGTIDARTTAVAQDLTEGLRARAKVGNGPYQVAPNSDRELIDEKLIKQCDNEAPACMSQIGKDIGADILVFGKLDKEEGNFRATLHLLDVNTKSKLNRISITIPLGASSDDARNLAKKGYAELTGASSAGAGGTILITANVDTGKVFVDDESRETVTGGKATLSLPEGRYRIAVESPGRPRLEKAITIVAEQILNERFELEGGPGGGGKGFNVWKPIFYTTATVGAGLGIYSLVLLKQLKDDADGLEGSKPGNGPINPGDDCIGSQPDPEVMVTRGDLAALCKKNQRQIVTAVVATGIGVVALASGYMAFFRANKEAPASTARRGKPERAMALTPVVGEDGAGAVFQMTW